VDLFAHLFFGEPGFVKAAGRRSGEVFRDDGEGSPETVAFEGAYNLDACPFLNVVQYFHVPAKAFFVQNETGTAGLCVIGHVPNIGKEAKGAFFASFWGCFARKKVFFYDILLSFKKSFN
jgi:hypothetical protein